MERCSLRDNPPERIETMQDHKNKQAKTWIDLAREVLDIEIDGLLQVKNDLGENFFKSLECLARCRGRIVVTGIGKSGLVGRKIAATLSSTGSPSFFLHPVEGAHGDLGMIQRGDVCLAISYSGETEELLSIIPVIKSLGAAIISITGNMNSSLAKISDHVISCKVPREACTLNLAPTTSTTATLALGDALAVCLARWKEFKKEDFHRYHPGGELGKRLALDIEKIMQRENLPLVPLKTTLKEALEVLDKGGLGTVIIVDNQKKLKGIITDGDVRRMVCRRSLSLEDPVEDYMTSNPRFGREGETAARMLDIMEQAAITVLPVVNKDMQVKGVVHLHDLLGKGTLRFNGC